jgi:hypothetical protein
MSSRTAGATQRNCLEKKRKEKKRKEKKRKCLPKIRLWASLQGTF